MPEPIDVLTARPLGPDDLDAVCDLVAESDLATRGLRRLHPGRDRRRPAPRRPSSAPAGTTSTAPCRLRLAAAHRGDQPGRGRRLRPPVVRRRLGHEVLARLEERGRELAAEAGHAEPWTGMGVYRQDVRTQVWLAPPATASTPPSPGCGSTSTRQPAGRAPPTDVVVRRVTDEADLRGARHRRGVLPRALRLRADHVRSLAHRLTERGAGLRRGSSWPRSTARPLGLLSPPTSSRTRTPATSAPSASCATAAGGGRKALLRDCFAAGRSAPGARRCCCTSTSPTSPARCGSTSRSACARCWRSTRWRRATRRRHRRPPHHHFLSADASRFRAGGRSPRS